MGQETYRFDREIVRGDDRTITLWFVDTTVSDYQFFFTAKKRYTNPDEIAAIKVDPDEVVFSDHTGAGYMDTVTFWLTNTKTDIEPGKYQYDIKLITPSNIVNTIMFGDLEILTHQTIRKT